MEKLQILGFSDSELQNQVGSCEVFVDPKALSLKTHAPHAQEEGEEMRRSFRTVEPQTLSFDFVLDESLPTSGTKDLVGSMNEFRDVVYDYHGQIHSPNYLKVISKKTGVSLHAAIFGRPLHVI